MHLYDLYNSTFCTLLKYLCLNFAGASGNIENIYFDMRTISIIFTNKIFLSLVFEQVDPQVACFSQVLSWSYLMKMCALLL